MSVSACVVKTYFVSPVFRKVFSWRSQYLAAVLSVSDVLRDFVCDFGTVLLYNNKNSSKNRARQLYFNFNGEKRTCCIVFFR